MVMAIITSSEQPHCVCENMHSEYCVFMVVETWASSMDLWSLISKSVQPHYVWQILHGGYHFYGDEQYR